jgi:hypothetical protein
MWVRSKTYNAWVDMRQRCRNPRNKNYPIYGGRGITICARWDSFKSFLADMGEAPAGLTLDRIDVNGPYAPGNCRWATFVEQQQNRRDTRRITFGDETHCIEEWGRRTGLGQTLSHRLRRGWSIERALTTPIIVASALLAACTTVSVDALQDQRHCSRYVDLFLDRTEHAPTPGTTQASHGNFEIAEAGQLELSDRDKLLAKQVLHMCEKEGDDALARAKHAMKPWWKRIVS